MSDLFDRIPPSLYDLSLPFVVPGVKRAQAIRALCFRDRVRPAHCPIGLDVGIGTGADLMLLMEGFQNFHVYGIDQSSNLTAALSHRIATKKLGAGSIEIVAGDFTQWQTFVPVHESQPEGLDFATSSFAIHNVPLEMQKEAFFNIASLLKPRAPFFYLDLIGYDASNLQEIADQVDLEFIEQEMSVVPAGVDANEWHRLRERWIQHYRYENYITPLNSSNQSSVVSMMKDVGFNHPEVLYREYNTTLIVAQRS